MSKAWVSAKAEHRMAGERKGGNAKTDGVNQNQEEAGRSEKLVIKSL